MPERVQVRVPATTANLGPGFDAVGLALELVNTFTFSRTGEPGLLVTARGIDTERLPLSEENLCWRAFAAACEAFGQPVTGSMRLEIECGVPQAGGLGSSATAIVGGVLAAAAFCGAPLEPGAHLELCTRLEGHPDNVAPALLGGLVVAVAGEGAGGVVYLQAPAPDLVCALCSPAVELSTKAARAALPESVPHRDAVFNGAHAALLVAALTTGRYDVLRTAMADRLHQPYRAPLIPGLERALAAAGEAGACGACLSGAGPTALALCPDEATAERAAGLMQQAFAAAGLTSGARVVRPRARGAEVLVSVRPPGAAPALGLHAAIDRRTKAPGRAPAEAFFVKIMVQKYGGSSVATPEKIQNVARRVIENQDAGWSVAVVVSALGDTTDELIALARQLNERPPKREMDMLLSTGEQISIALLAMAISDKGREAISFTGPQAGIQTDRSYSKARIQRVDPLRVQAALSAGKIAVVAGFQGLNDADDITTLGRGGSDTTAVALAAALDAEVCEIYTDVEGVFTADPRVEPQARKLRDISYGEMLEMASLGAVVLQPRSVEYGAIHGVPIHVRSTFSANSGTMVREDRILEKDMMVVGCAHDTNVAKITVLGVPDRPGVAAALFSRLAEEGVNVDMIVQTNRESQATDMLFSVSHDDLPAAKEATDAVARELGAQGTLCDERVAKVSIVGAGMVSNPGVAAKMFSTLAAQGVNIQVISTSEIKISCLIAADQVKPAVRAIHAAFELGEPPAI